MSMPSNAVPVIATHPEDGHVEAHIWGRVEAFLVGAREHIATHGWCQGKMYADGMGMDIDQPACVAGALEATLIRRHDGLNNRIVMQALDAAYRVLARNMRDAAIKRNWLRPINATRNMMITELNDQHMFNAEAILEAFDAAIFYVRTQRALSIPDNS